MVKPKMRIISSRELMYITGIILLPVAVLLKGMYLYSIGVFVLSILLINFDPLFKAFRKQILESDKYIFLNLFVGSCIGLIIYFIPHIKTFLVLIWFVFISFYGCRIANKVKINNKAIK